MIKKIINLFKGKKKQKIKKETLINKKKNNAKVINFINTAKNKKKIQTEKMEINKMDELAQELVENYRVAGKSGTAKKANAGGYTEDSYQSVFAGIIPATAPRLSMVVMVDDPQGEEYYGGLVAAPVFSEVMSGAMRLLNIAPDGLAEKQLQMASN